MRLQIERLEKCGPQEASSERILRKAELDEMGEEIEQLIRLLRSVFSGEEPSLTLLIGSNSVYTKPKKKEARTSLSYEEVI